MWRNKVRNTSLRKAFNRKERKKKTEQTKPEIHHLLLHMSEFSNETFLLQEKALEKVIGSIEKRCHPRD